MSVACSCPDSVPCVFVFRVGGYCLSVDISYNSFIVLFSLLCSGMQFWISCTTLIGHYIGSIILGDRQIFYS